MKVIKAKIETLKYRPGQLMKDSELKEYDFKGFDINKAQAAGVVNVDSKNKLAYSKWVTPKRTRSYPFARIYDIYNFGGKRVTVIPVIKDEGLGASKNKSNNDRINFITLSWMNLTNVFVILAWYTDAEKKSEYRITNQKFDNDYVKKKLKEISEYQLDAHHWNNEHFKSDFKEVYGNAVSAYERIAEDLNVKLHSSAGHLSFLEKIKDPENSSCISLDKFAEETLAKSKLAAAREIVVNHKHEFLSLDSEKLVFEMKNNLGGSYFLTADELIIDQSTKTIYIQEAKNATKDKLPKIADVKDGLFKILLFSQIKKITIDDIEYDYEVSLRLTGTLSSELALPCSKEEIDTFAEKEDLSNPERNLLAMLNEEASENNFKVKLSHNGTENS